MAAWANRVRDLKDRWMVLFLLDTAALREDEIVLIDMDAIEFTSCERPDGVIETVGRGSVPIQKSGKRREFLLSARTVEALSLYWTSCGGQDTRQVAFATSTGVLRRLKLIGMMIREWCYRLIVERLRLAEFRRGLARHLFG